MFVSLALYCNGLFATRPQSLSDLAELARATFDWGAFRYARGLSTTARGTGDRAFASRTLQSLARGLAERRFDRVWLAERSDREEATQPAPFNAAFLAVNIQSRSLTGLLSDPPNVMPCDVSMVAEVAESWPTSAQLQALLDIARVTEAQYGCVHVDMDRMRAESESVLVPATMMGEPDPPWAAQIHRMARYRNQIGERVRDAYWGNFLPEPVLQSIGGDSAVAATGAAAFTRVSVDLAYVQLTSTVADAFTGEGMARLERLRVLLAPVTVGA